MEFLDREVFDDEDACSSPPCTQLPPRRTETLEECVERIEARVRSSQQFYKCFCEKYGVVKNCSAEVGH